MEERLLGFLKPEILSLLKMDYYTRKQILKHEKTYNKNTYYISFIISK